MIQVCAITAKFQIVHNYTGWAKRQWTYVGLNSSVTECPIEIILSVMTYYLPPLVRGICQIEKYSSSFFSNEALFLHLFDNLDSRIELNFIELCLAIRISFVLKKVKLLLLR